LENIGKFLTMFRTVMYCRTYFIDTLHFYTSNIFYCISMENIQRELQCVYNNALNLYISDIPMTWSHSNTNGVRYKDSIYVMFCILVETFGKHWKLPYIVQYCIVLYTLYRYTALYNRIARKYCNVSITMHWKLLYISDICTSYCLRRPPQLSTTKASSSI
jgi:hypothetical protein